MKKVHLKSTGQIMSVDNTTANHLVSGGYAEYVDKNTSERPGEMPAPEDIKPTFFPQHLGEGVYLLPNGEKMQGKDAVIEAIFKMEEEHEEQPKKTADKKKNTKKKGGKAGK